jgi:nucleotide-binding universal stress UspA family protein
LSPKDKDSKTWKSINRFKSSRSGGEPMHDDMARGWQPVSHSRSTAMFKRILVPTDGSPLSEKAISSAIHFASVNGSEVIALSVAEPQHYIYSALSDGSSIMPIEAHDYNQKVIAPAQRYVAKVKAAAKERNVPCETVVTQSYRPYEEIIKAAKEFRCDVIFMASHGRNGLESLFIGSETQKVLAHSTIPVLVLR